MTEASIPTLRLSVLDRLIRLDEDGRLSADHVRSASRKLGVTERAIWQWLAARNMRNAPVVRKEIPEAATRRIGYRQAIAGQAGTAMVSMAAGDEVLPRLPDSDVDTFRADAYRGLSPEEFARVDAVYTEGIDSTCRWLTAHGGRPCRHDPGQKPDPNWLGPDDATLAEHMRTVLRPRRAVRRRLPDRPYAGQIDEWHDTLGLYRFLGELVSDSPGRAHTIARLRGAQAAFLLHGMRLDLPPDLTYSVGPGFTTTRLDEGTVERVRTRTGNPVDAAALTTVLFTGATVMELNAIPCVSLTPEALIFTGPIGCARAADVYVWVIPTPARPLLHAAREYQETRAQPNPKLLAGAVGGAGHRLQATATRCGVTIPELHHWHHSWIRQSGLLRRIEQPQYVRNTDLLFALHLTPRPRLPV
ncbi:hypothetical protein [Nocardia brevicatena]|uniref:hypothetical protein n=1 Tax=Nocardia brevicatena TaxID=37327 RepID=UPI0002D8BD10|nr:hypothetical protein [Nocardia brevicatena]